jgi:hypothetical protein
MSTWEGRPAAWLPDVTREYAVDDGFVGQLRQGVLDQMAFERLLRTLRGIPTPLESSSMTKREVSVLWMLPTLVEWQSGHLVKRGADARHLDRMQAEVRTKIERILGVP